MAGLWNSALPVIDASLAYLAIVALKAFLVLLLALGINRLALRRASASLRHLVWTLALAAVLLLPALTPLTPRWSIPVLPATQNREVPMPEPEVQAPEGPLTPSNPADRGSARSGETEPLAPAPASTGPRIALAQGHRVEAETSEPAAVGHTEKVESLESASPIQPVTLAVVVWALGFLAVGLWIVEGLVRAGQLGRRARKVSGGPAVRLLERLSAEAGVRRRVVLLEGAPDRTPMTWGVLRPRILLPSTFKSWSSARLRAVMLHELAHVRRYDCLTQLLARLACGLHWFNPLVWLAAAGMREERERACDDAVLRAGPLPSEYATHLLDVARGATVRGGVAVAMARSQRLGDRVQAVLDASRSRRRPGLAARASLLLASALVVLPLAGAAPAERSAAIVTESDRPQLEVSEVRPMISANNGPAMQEAGALGCDWLGREGSSSTSVNIDDDDLRARLSRGDCELKIDLSGDVRFNAGETDVAALSRGGRLEIEEKRGRRSRRLVIESDRDGRLDRGWYMDGSESEFDGDARSWLADMISVLHRRAGFQATERAERILVRSGADGLLEEIARIPGDHVAMRYYTVLLSQAELEPERMRQIIGRLGEEIESDHTLARLLITIAENHPLEESVQAAYVATAASLESDHQHRRVLAAILRRGDLSPEVADRMLDDAVRIESDHQLAQLLMDVAEVYPRDRRLPSSYLNAARSIDSDHQLTRVLMTLLQRDELGPAAVGDLLEVATTLESDHQTGRLLRAVLEERGLEDDYRGLFFDLVERLSSDHERRRVLDAVLDTRPLTRAAVESILQASLEIESDHEMSRLLVRLAEQHPLDDDLRAAYMGAVETIESERERRRAVEAISPRSN